MSTEESPSEAESQSAQLTKIAAIAAAVTLLFFAALAVYMIVTSDEVSSEIWQRQVFIYASIEAIVFAAAGALFGVQVKKGEANAATSRAVQAEEEAAEAKRSEQVSAQDAQKGRTMAATARGLARATSAPRSGTASTPGTPSARGDTGMSATEALRALNDVADELFPLS